MTIKGDKKAIVAAGVSASGKGVASLIKILQVNGSEISQPDFDKIFLFLRQTVDVVEQQARKDRVVTNASTFSFDMDFTAEIEAAKKVTYRSPLFHEQQPTRTNPVSEYGIMEGKIHPVMETDSPKLSALDELMIGALDEDAPTTVMPMPELPVAWSKPVGRVSANSPNTAMAGKAVHVPLKTASAPSTLDGSGTVGDRTKRAGPVGFLDDNE